MTRTLVVLASVAALLVALERLLPGSARDAENAPRLVRLADAARGSDTVVAGLSVERPSTAERFLYVRSRGVWRCLSAWGAPCDARRVEGLVVGLLGARGVERALGPDADGAFGFGAPGALELALHGRALLDDPGGDELLRVRFGAVTRPAAGAAPAGSTFARVASRQHALELDFDAHAALGEPSAPGLPPLLDARLVPGDFPGTGRRVERLFLDRAEGPDLELVRREREALPPAEHVAPAETLDWEWLLIEGERQQVIPPLRGEAYVTWSPRAPYVALADPKSAGERGLASPRARLTIVPDAGEPLELEVGAATPQGGIWVRVPSVPLLAAVDARTARMLLPDASELADDGLRNLWDEELRAALASRR